MFDKLLSPETIEETLRIVQNEFPLAIWETIYVTLIATAFAIVIGLPLGVLLVAGEKDGGDSAAVPHLGAGVLGVFQQPAPVALIFKTLPYFIV